ncbi:MAG: PAS domain S-box protein, partial [Candidatus Binatia bacterium]
MPARAATVLPPAASVSDARAVYAAERSDAVERRIARTRLTAAAVGTVLYGWVLDPAGTLPAVAWGTLGAAWIYSLYAAFLRGDRPSAHVLSGYVETVIDGLFVLFWIVATGGARSEFYVLIYGSVVAIAFQHGYRESMLGTAAYAAAYIAVVAALGQLDDHLGQTLVRASILLLIGPLGALLAREALEQGQAKIEMRKLTRAAEAARSKLEKSLSLLQATLDSTADGILAVDGAGRIVQTNQRFMDMWNLPVSILRSGEERRGIDFALGKLRNPEAFDRCIREIHENPESESFDVLELTDGRVFERYSRPQRIGDRTAGRVWSFRDVTERRRAEAALQESEAKFRQIFDVNADGVAVTRLSDNRIVEVNESYCRISGYRREEVVGKTAAELRAWVDLAEREAVLARLRADGVVHNFEAALRCKDGRTLCGLLSACVAPMAGEPSIFWFIRDIAEEKVAREAVRRSEEKYRTLFEQSKDALFIAALDGELLDANQAAVELFGYGSKQELLRLRPESFLVDPRNRGVARRAVETQGFLRDFELRAKRKDGEILTLLLTATPMLDDQGELVGVRGLARDVSA